MHIHIFAKVGEQPQLLLLDCHPSCFETGLTLTGLTFIDWLGWLANAYQDPPAPVTPVLPRPVLVFCF